MAIVTGDPAVADAIFRSPDTSDQCVGDVACQLVCRPHRNRRPALRVRMLPEVVRDLVLHPNYGLPDDEIAALLHDVFKMSPPLALHLIGVLGLTHPDWLQGVVSDASDAGEFALEIGMAMLAPGEPVSVEDDDDDKGDDEMECDETQKKDDTLDLLGHAPAPLGSIRAFLSRAHDDDDDMLAALDSLLDKIKVDGDLASSYNTIIQPLGGISWIMSLLGHSNPRIASHGSRLLLAVIKSPLSPVDALACTGAVHSLATFLSRACTQSGIRVKPAWTVVEKIAAARTAFLRELLHSHLLKSIATLGSTNTDTGTSSDVEETTGTAEVEDGGNLGKAIQVVGDLYFAASKDQIAHQVADDFAAAVVAIGRNIERIAAEGHLGKFQWMFGMILGNPVASILGLFFEQVDIVSQFQRVLCGPDTGAAVGSKKHGNKGSHYYAFSIILTLAHHRCGRMIAATCPWDRILGLVVRDAHDPNSTLSAAVLRTFFGCLDFLEATGLPPMPVPEVDDPNDEDYVVTEDDKEVHVSDNEGSDEEAPDDEGSEEEGSEDEGAESGVEPGVDVGEDEDEEADDQDADDEEVEDADDEDVEVENDDTEGQVKVKVEDAEIEESTFESEASASETDESEDGDSEADEDDSEDEDAEAPPAIDWGVWLAEADAIITTDWYKQFAELLGRPKSGAKFETNLEMWGGDLTRLEPRLDALRRSPIMRQLVEGNARLARALIDAADRGVVTTRRELVTRLVKTCDKIPTANLMRACAACKPLSKGESFLPCPECRVRVKELVF
ncbi:hypothetical protein BC828DRAFT_412532 [Blastocladiella britannica]|nr:hypothetical protein BC828DRAFT_412532 [Blastocladiella britannica]